MLGCLEKGIGRGRKAATATNKPCYMPWIDWKSPAPGGASQPDHGFSSRNSPRTLSPLPLQGLRNLSCGRSHANYQARRGTRRLKSGVLQHFLHVPIPGEEREVTCTASSQVQEQSLSLRLLESAFGPVRHEIRPKGRRNFA